MGMFNYINYEANCEECGTPLKGFQSKDGACEMKYLPPSDVDYFYTLCSKCNTWHDFKVTRVCICQVKSIDVTTRK